MPRIKIEDVQKNTMLSPSELRNVLGGVGLESSRVFRPVASPRDFEPVGFRPLTGFRPAGLPGEPWKPNNQPGEQW